MGGRPASTLRSCSRSRIPGTESEYWSGTSQVTPTGSVWSSATRLSTTSRPPIPRASRLWPTDFGSGGRSGSIIPMAETSCPVVTASRRSAGSGSWRPSPGAPGDWGSRWSSQRTSSTSHLWDGADLIVGADGANSMVRRELAAELVPGVDERRNRYVWFGTDKVFPEFNFIFVDTPDGMVWAHVYPYSDEGSTFIVETSPETWTALGLDATAGETIEPGASDQLALERCSDLFSDFLEGHRLLGNNSKWLRFPTVTCARWHHGNVVLIGDAAHTAHFSVGSGTKLAMEDAIALTGVLAAGAPLRRCACRL